MGSCDGGGAGCGAGADGDGGVGTAGAADTSYTDTTVEPETHYGYRVIAINETGSSPRSLNVSLTTHAATQQNGFGIDGTDDVDFDPELRDAQIDPYEITMELPEGCVLHELDSDGSTPWMVTDDDCAAVDQPGPLSDRVVAQYFRLAVVAESTVTLQPGVYVVEVARQLDLFGQLGFKLLYEGDHIHTGDATKLSDLEISGVSLTDFNHSTADYARNVALRK